MTDTSPTDQIRVDDLARLLSAADVHINHGDYPTWDTLGESGQGEYRKAARYLLARCRITPRTTRTGSDQQPRETGQTAPHGPHGPSGAPVAPATPERAAGGRTAVRKRLEHARDAAALHRQGLLSTAELYAVIEADPAEPTAWVDGDPLMEAIAAAIWEHCRTEGTSLVVDDPRNIAAVAAHTARTTPDSPADSQDNQQDSTDSAPGHGPLTRADTVRTGQDTTQDDALREQYAETLDELYTRRDFDAEEFADAVLAVRDRRVEQLAAEVRRLHEAVRDRDERHNRQVQLGIRVEKRAERAEAEVTRWLAFIERGITEHMQFGLLHPDGTTEQLPCADWCYACRVEKAEAAIARVRDLAHDMDGITGARTWARWLRDALDGPPPTEAPAPEQQLKETVPRGVLDVLLNRAARGVLTTAEGPLLRQHIEHLIADRDQMAAVLREVLAEFRFETHPGRRCLQTGHIDVGTVERWRAALDKQ
ncbi:hypothetical protein ACH4TQ_27460 [Streptomyces sp. NPDC021218]|uniref:hypothetical protein n=1 Tax=Streptomyces sp. NPDC021218 TaxID=3365119 RepID=UPI0037AAFC1B